MIKKYVEYIVEPLKWMWLKYKNRFKDKKVKGIFMEFNIIKGVSAGFAGLFFLFSFIVFPPSIFIMNKLKVLTGFDYNSSSIAAFILFIIMGLLFVISYSLGIRVTRHLGRKIKKKYDEDLKKQGERMDLKLQKEAEARKEKNG